MKKLTRKIALITGASTGIGAGVAIAYAREGADVVINYPDKAQEKNSKAVASAVQLAIRLARTSAFWAAICRVAQASTKPLAKVWVAGLKFSARFGARNEVLKLVLKAMSWIGRQTRFTPYTSPSPAVV